MLGPQVTPAERLDYIADMLFELEHMAAEGGHASLSEVLRTAWEHAQQVRDETD